ncbi:MAG: phosphate ABC transporter permease subunit PstC [Chloroflexi bacterium GWC2_73_18]|nr:MAG: phosphate ABC transporter permease subunit PstC [Chloroflexi bacterium GWC2_73_18]
MTVRPGGLRPLTRTRTGDLAERAIVLALRGCALVSILTTVGLVAILLVEALDFFGRVSIVDFLTQAKWTPLFSSKEFGIVVLISATLLTTLIAMLVALPVGLLAAIYLSEYAPERQRRILKPAIEVLAGIPTVVYGYFALQFVTGVLLKGLLGDAISTFNGLSAGLVMGVMIIPLVASLSEDALYAVPQSLRAGSYALGATRFETSLRVVVPAALSGIVAAFVLAVGRAVGETMIVAIAAGQSPRLGLDPFVPIETMTSYIVQVALGDTPVGSIEFLTIFAVGATLFAMTLLLNLFSAWFTRRYREAYQ